MKKIVIVIFCLLGIYSQAISQSVNLESSIKADTAKTQVLIQRIQVTTKIVDFKYDYKATGDDVLGITIPNIWSDSTTTLSGMMVKLGDGGPKDQYVFDLWSTKKFGKLSTLLEIGRMVSATSIPWDYAGARLSYANFTIEAYALAYHPIEQPLTKTDSYFAWIAYHPEHAFFAIGKQDKQYWGFLGTKNLKHFGNFNFVNYQPETKNFWFRSQTGFGEINQKFFCQDMYIDGTSYLVVPVFYYKHFSPILTKGTYSLRIEGRRTAGVSNYEVMMGRVIGNDWLRFGVGVNSIFSKESDLRSAPSFELYKSWKKDNKVCIVELRYDVLYKAFSAYLTMRY